jgi:hypothetical protein
MGIELEPCPFCDDPMQVRGTLLCHVDQGKCVIGQQAWDITDLPRWNTRPSSRNAVLEEAAKVARNVGRPVGAGDGCGTRIPGTAADAAAAIRALKDKTEVDEEAVGDDAPETCMACDRPLQEGDLVLGDVSGGLIHRACCGEDRESYVDADGEPLSGDQPIPAGWLYDDKTEVV